MAWLEGNMAIFLIFIGLALLAIEVMVLSFSIMLLFFIGVGFLVTGLLMFVGLIPQTLVGALVGLSIVTVLASALLWKPLRRLQDKVDTKSVTSDLIGNTFTLETNISESQPGQVRFSGVDWRIVCDGELPAGTDVKVVKVSVGELTVARAEAV